MERKANKMAEDKAKGECVKRNLVCLVIILFVGTVVLTACGRNKEPAESAIKAAEEAIRSTRPEAAKYVPDQVKSLDDTLVSVKDKFDKGKYKAVISEAQSLAGKAKEVVEAGKARKEELTRSWTDLSGRVPMMLEAIQGRVDILSKSKKLPANLTAGKFAEAKSALAAVGEEWAKALEGFKSGNLPFAVSLANSVKEKAEKTMEILGLPMPATQTAPEKAPAAQK